MGACPQASRIGLLRSKLQLGLFGRDEREARGVSAGQQASSFLVRGTIKAMKKLGEEVAKGSLEGRENNDAQNAKIQKDVSKPEIQIYQCFYMTTESVEQSQFGG